MSLWCHQFPIPNEPHLQMKLYDSCLWSLFKGVDPVTASAWWLTHRCLWTDSPRVFEAQLDKLTLQTIFMQSHCIKHFVGDGTDIDVLLFVALFVYEKRPIKIINLALFMPFCNTQTIFNLLKTSLVYMVNLFHLLPI